MSIAETRLNLGEHRFDGKRVVRVYCASVAATSAHTVARTDPRSKPTVTGPLKYTDSMASSLSTYLGVTQAASRSDATRVIQEDDADSTLQTAEVLAAIHSGAKSVGELPAKTDLDIPQILSALAWLSKARMIEFDEAHGSLRLTEPAKAALSAS